MKEITVPTPENKNGVSKVEIDNYKQLGSQLHMRVTAKNAEGTIVKRYAHVVELNTVVEADVLSSLDAKFLEDETSKDESTSKSGSEKPNGKKKNGKDDKKKDATKEQKDVEIKKPAVLTDIKNAAGSDTTTKITELGSDDKSGSGSEEVK